MNDVLFGGLMTLHQIPPSQIERMEFIRAIERPYVGALDTRLG
ncbi:MAG: hypothetical protein Ct9H300mP15_24950 [Gemmatimonadota bacterium]|nr:MAG: hypothetical protein Ct9H300mP15_24950 [Gemmatimonadota bacterium]